MLSNSATLILYLSVFFLSSYLFHIAASESTSVSARKLYVLLAFAMPVMLAGFRACGTDIYTYAGYYGGALRVPILWPWQEEGSFELAYTLLARFARKLGSIRILMTTCAVITVLPVYKAIWEQRKTQVVFLAVLTFLMNFFPTSWNIIRQYMAIGIVCYAYKYVFEKNLKKYIICVLLATFCHTSAVVAIPVYFLWSKKGDLITDWRLWGLIIGMIVVSSNFSLLAGNLGGGLERYETYLDSEAGGANRDFFVSVATTLVIAIFIKPLSQFDKRNKFYFVLLILQCILGLTGFSSPFIKRIGLYFGITLIFLLGSLPMVLRDRHTRIVAMICILAYVVGLFVIVDYFLNQPKIVPYKWIFPEGLF